MTALIKVVALRKHQTNYVRVTYNGELAAVVACSLTELITNELKQRDIGEQMIDRNFTIEQIEHVADFISPRLSVTA